MLRDARQKVCSTRSLSACPFDSCLFAVLMRCCQAVMIGPTWTWSWTWAAAAVGVRQESCGATRRQSRRQRTHPILSILWKAVWAWQFQETRTFNSSALWPKSRHKLSPKLGQLLRQGYNELGKKTACTCLLLSRTCSDYALQKNCTCLTLWVVCHKNEAMKMSRRKMH